MGGVLNCCSENKETLNEFYDSYIALSFNDQQTEFFLRCVQRCKEIIFAHKGAFPLRLRTN